MADNYLEKQMEQYQARKAAWERERKFGKKKTTGKAAVKTAPAPAKNPDKPI